MRHELIACQEVAQAREIGEGSVGSKHKNKSGSNIDIEPGALRKPLCKSFRRNIDSSKMPLAHESFVKAAIRRLRSECSDSPVQ